MINFERIKAMSLEEMADILSNDDVLVEPCNAKYCNHFREDGNCEVFKETECHKATVKWLESEVESND